MKKSILDMTLTERREYQLGTDALRQIEYDIHNQFERDETIPLEWHKIGQVKDHRDVKSTRVTIRLDADVVKFFRTLGPGYQPRMNRVLRAFMHMRRAKVVHGPDTTDYIVNPERLLAGLSDKRPEWGDEQAMEAELDQDWEERRKVLADRKRKQKLTDASRRVEALRRKREEGE